MVEDAAAEIDVLAEGAGADSPDGADEASAEAGSDEDDSSDDEAEDDTETADWNHGVARPLKSGRRLAAHMTEAARSGGSATSVGDAVVLGIVTVSDRASDGTYEDRSGPAILEFYHEAVRSPWRAEVRLVPDEQPAIEAALREFADVHGCAFIATTGGTGPAVRDVTPEATEAVCERLLPGFGEQMRAISLQYVPTAILSRQTAGTRGPCLILNLPGQPKAIRETIDEVFRAVPYAIDLIGGPYLDTDPAVCDAFRPKAARRDGVDVDR